MIADVAARGTNRKPILVGVSEGAGLSVHKPTFSVAAMVDRMAPLPLGAIHSTQDEFVPIAQIQRVFERAREPKKLWIIKARDHRFSDNLPEFDRCLLEALTWITQHSAG
jgi:fermentation-respiration switch protein FrsA (DUF1100 family)